jgi:hypothetical protein
MSWRVALGIAALILLALAVGLLAPPYSDREDAIACAGLYAAAQTAADTARIDDNFSLKERGRQYRNSVRTCGDLRRAGVRPLRP